MYLNYSTSFRFKFSCHLILSGVDIITKETNVLYESFHIWICDFFLFIELEYSQLLHALTLLNI